MAQEACVNAIAARSGGSASISGAGAWGRPSLLVRRDVIDSLADGRDLLGVLVRDLDPELILELHDQLDEVERVRVEILLERRLLGDVCLFDPELLGQYFLDSLEDFLARRCHVTSFVSGPGKSRRSYHPRGRGPGVCEGADHIVVDAAGG